MLDHGYGVLTGRLLSHRRDTPDDRGRWYHVNLTVSVAGRTYRVAVDVDSGQSSTGVQWKVVRAAREDLGPVPFDDEGWHPLVSAPGTGALDFVRSRLARTWRPRRRRLKGVPIPGLVPQPWISGTSRDASAALEHVLRLGEPILVWGEPFSSGLGVHNVHQNQGDPVGSPWALENGVWQDGAVGVPQPGGDYRLFLSKFSSQALATDEDGHPV